VNTPALRGYQRHLWITSESALTDAYGPFARYILKIPDLAGTDPDPRASLNAIFDWLETGWSASSPSA